MIANRSTVRIMVTALHVAARVADYYDNEPPRYEACAGCGRHNRLVKRGKVWCQPDHKCEGEA